ncbi:MAG: hypothetical protein WAM70_08685 [Pyrinomonadaceae bacterium]
MRKHSKWVAILVLASLFQSGVVLVRAQDIIPANAFLLRNRNDRQIIFYLRKDSDDWERYGLAAGAEGIFKNKNQIWIKTEDQEPVHYYLRLGCRYRIVWQDERWDVEKLGL